MPKAKLNVVSIVLEECSASRNFDVAFDPPGRASVNFHVDPAGSSEDARVVSTKYEVRLSTEDDETVATIASTFVVLLEVLGVSSGADVDTVARRIASTAAHPYHRELILEMSEKFDIPAYRLDFVFDRELLREEEVAAQT